MDVNKIKSVLINCLSPTKIYVNKDDGNHYQIIIVSDQFISMNRLEREKVIYAPLMEYITNGCIHSLSLQVFTLLEWESEYKCDSLRLM